MDIESLVDIESLIGQKELRCCSTSIYILVLGYIFMLGLLGQEVSLLFSYSYAYFFAAITPVSARHLGYLLLQGYPFT